MTCLHCEISELIQARQARGEEIDRTTVGKLVEVISYIINSAPPAERVEAVVFVIQLLGSLTGGTVLSTEGPAAETAKPH